MWNNHIVKSTALYKPSTIRCKNNLERTTGPKHFHTLFGRAKVDVEDDSSSTTTDSDSIGLDIDE